MTIKNQVSKIDLPKDTTPLILEGDVLECLKKIPDNSISVVVTSPPYWNLRDYEIRRVLGVLCKRQNFILPKFANANFFYTDSVIRN